MRKEKRFCFFNFKNTRKMEKNDDDSGEVCFLEHFDFLLSRDGRP